MSALDEQVNLADRKLWAEFEKWCALNEDPLFKLHFYETINFQDGVLLFCICRNHRNKPVLDMLDWIATNGPGSYGLFYVSDDEDGHNVECDPRRFSRFDPPVNYDYSNVFRVHRIANGTVTELDDPFFGPIVPNLDPPSPFDCEDSEVG